MRKNISYKMLGLALIIVSIVACDTADQDVSPVISPDGKPKGTFSTDFSNSSVLEGDTIIYNITIDKIIERSITFSARVIDGTADENDITVTPGVIKPYTTATTVTIVFNQDWDAETSETMKLEIGAFSIADRYLVNPSNVNPILNITLNNYVSDILTVSLDWAKDIVVLHIVDVKVDVGTYFTTLRDTVDVTKNTSAIDYDIFVSDAAGFDISNPWVVDPVAMAATGDCPEVLELAGLDDGEYIIWSDLWANGMEATTAPTKFYAYKDSSQLALVTSTFTRQGTELDLVVAQDSLTAPFVYTPGFDDDGTVTDAILAKVIVADGKYTIVNFEGTESGPWKASAAKTPRPGNIKTR